MSKETKEKTKTIKKTEKTVQKTEPVEFKFFEKQVNEYGATCIFKNVRLAWVNLARPNTRFGNKDQDGNVFTGSFEVSMLIPESDRFLQQLEKTLTAVCNNSRNLKTAQDKQKALRIATGWFKEGSPVKLGENVLDKNSQVYAGFNGNFVIKAKTQAELDKSGNWKPKKAIKILFPNKETIPADKIDQEIYGGVFADVQCSFVAYSAGKNIGVTCYLDGVMKTKNGERLASAPDFFDDRSDEFDQFDDDEEGL